jgi:hypothetical protein
MPTLVGVILAYVDGPDVGGGEREVGLLESRSIVESGWIFK